MTRFDLENDRDLGRFSVGRGTYWDPSTEFRTYTAEERIVIGRYCSIAPRVTIIAGGEHNADLPSTWPFDNFLRGRRNPTRTYRTIQSTIIGSDVWIGYGAHVAGGANVGHGAIIGAHAVVVKDIPPYAIVIGNPARILRFRFEPPVIQKLLDIAWWNWSPREISERLDSFYMTAAQFVDIYAPKSS